VKILIVEDEALVAMSLRFLLEANGYDITDVTDDIEGAIASCERAVPDVALVDIRLAHGSSGYEVAAELRNRGVPCFFLTGNAPEEPRGDLALGCIEKPYTEDVLIAALRVAEQRRTGGPPVDDIPDELILY
jgi:CheY-like chemotaxis protein